MKIVNIALIAASAYAVKLDQLLNGMTQTETEELMDFMLAQTETETEGYGGGPRKPWWWYK